MSEISFEVKQDGLSLIQHTQIEANFDEVKAALTEMVEPYKTMVVTEDGIAAAKADRAKLRKIATRIEEVRKTVKKAYQEPLTAFENKCKELVSVITDGSDNLDKQVKQYEEKTADEKIQNLHSEYIAMTDEEIESYCPWGVINNPKWRNAGYKYDDAVSEIRLEIENTRDDLAAIRDMGGDDTPYLLDIYKQTRNLSAVVKKASDLKTMRQREEQRARDEAERRAAMDKERIAKEAPRPRNDNEKPQPEPDAYVEDTPPENTKYHVTFWVDCTKEQLIALGNFMKENGIRYGKA